MELINTPSDARARAIAEELITNIIPNELQALLPPSLRLEQDASKIAHLLFRALIEKKLEEAWRGNGLEKLLGYGGPF